MVWVNHSLTEIVFLLDRSGSMGGLESDTIGGFNSFVEKQRQQEGETVVTAVLFDHIYELLWNGIDAAKAKLTEEQYYVRGSTALLDAIGKTILDVSYRLSRTSDALKPGKVIFVITTDGMENSSREFTYKKVRELIKHHQEKYGWEFVFLGANIDAVQEAESMGIARDNAFNFEATKDGVEKMYCCLSKTVSERRRRPGKRQ